MTIPASAPADILLTSTDDGVLTVTLNRPAAYNAFNGPLKSALLTTLREAAVDERVRAVVITGSGQAFCAGQDLKEHHARIAAGDTTVSDTVTEFYNPMIELITTMRKPVIAAINGVAAGAGAALACACDLRLASSAAGFTMAFARVALSTDSGLSHLLPRMIGRGRAMNLLLTGRTVDAPEAARIGLVDEVVPEAELLDHCHLLATRLAEGPAVALGLIKASVEFAAQHTLAQALDFEDSAQRECFASEDHAEALAAFVGKREPVFRRQH